jgi:D-methionine transport system permease protein
MIDLLIHSTCQTLLMVGISSLIGILGGLPLAILLWATDQGGLKDNRKIHQGVGLVVNALRSIPYIILVIGLIPVTRWIVGSSIGTLAASVPLSLAAIMLVCRSGEEALRTVPKGLTEAALAMGARRRQVIRKVLIPEALPSLVSALTLVMINLVGFSAMAGAVGGGGLGDLAIRYGYQRYDLALVLEVMAILIILVQGIQSLGDFLIRKLRP